MDTGTEITSLQTKDLTSNTFVFTHVADSQEFPVHFGNVLKTVYGTTDFLLHTGDVVESSKYEQEWTSMLQGNFEYLSKIPMMAISGNHETTYKNGSNETYKHFHNKIPTQTSTRQGYFYSFIYGNTKFIMLNTNELSGNQLKLEQYNWLVNELKNNTATWTIVAMHNPMYSVGKYGMNETINHACLGLRSQLQALFAQYGVDLVLQGHDHAVSRTYPISSMGQPQQEIVEMRGGVEYSINPKGVIYLMNGTAGYQTREPYATDSTVYKYAQGSVASSWAQFEISDYMMKVSVNYYTASGVKTYQSWGIIKSK